MAVEITQEKIDQAYSKLKNDAEVGGYHLSNDREMVDDLVRGLLTNETRFGYMSCPCRRATGKRDDDLDIICPCDYRDPDLTDYNACFCGLYVTEKVLRGEVKLQSIPERREPKEIRQAKKSEDPMGIGKLPLPVWRCQVCGYLCGREYPPEVCPICKVPKERFERFI